MAAPPPPLRAEGVACFRQGGIPSVGGTRHSSPDTTGAAVAGVPLNIGLERVQICSA